MNMNIMKINTFLFLAAAGLSLLAVSCDKGDGYEPGPEAPDGCISAYFTSSNESSVILTPEEYAKSNVITLQVERMVSDATVSVPIEVVQKSEQIEIPAAVEFQAGESTSSIDIKLNNLEEKVDYTFTIKLAEDYVNPYTIKDGSDIFSGSVLIAKWVKVVEDGTFYFNNEYFPTTYSDIYHLDGFNKFYIENFLGSGVNLGFSIKSYNSSTGAFVPFSATDKSTWAGKMEPLDHYLDDPDGGYYWWLMKDVVTQDYASWTPEGWSVGIDYINFYTTDDTTYIWIDMNGSTASFTGYMCSYTYLSDGSTPGYIYLYMYWDSMVKE
jgi:hypothetical protein